MTQKGTQDMESTTRTIGYIRVSTTGQVEEGVSLEAQAKKIRAYCDLHDLELLEIVEDAGLSGKSIAGRPGIQRVLEMVRTRKIDNVVIFKLDRMARNLKEACEIAETMQKKNVALHSISEKLDTESATGRLFYNILSAMAAWEREIIGERTAVALEHKAAQGERTNFQAPFGYRFENGKVVKDDIEHGIIRKVNELKEEGYSIRAIVALLEEQGHRNRNGKPIGRNEIWRITKKAA
jgi:DNA invertase Pin-like site-specific DNA recombinase